MLVAQRVRNILVNKISFQEDKQVTYVSFSGYDCTLTEMVDFMLKQELLCSICMEIYQEPATLRCGHSFCTTCITKTWDNQEGECTCPECRWKFRRRPELKINMRLENIARYIHFLQPEQEETNMFCSYTPDLTVNVSSTHEERLVDNLPNEIDKEAEKVSTKSANSPEMVNKHYSGKVSSNTSKMPNLQEEAKGCDYEETMNHHLSDCDSCVIKEITEDDYQAYNADKVTVHETTEIGEKVHPQQQQRMREQGKSSELREKLDVLLRKLKEQVDFTLETIQSDISKYKEKLSSHFLHLKLRHRRSRTEL